MIKYKQKEFVAWLMPVLTGAGVVATGAQMAQSSGQAKENEEQAERAEELMKKQNKKLDKIAKAAKSNPEVAQQAVDVVKQKGFAINASALSSLGKSVIQAGKGAFGKGMKSNIAVGSAVAGTTYLGGKYIQRDMKKNNMDVDENGNLVSKQYAVPASAIMNLKKAGNLVWKNKGTLGIGAALGGAPLVLGYQADKQQAKDQIEATQKEYAIGASALKGLAKGFKAFKAHPGQSTTGFINNMASFGIGGTKNVQKFAAGLSKYGSQNGSEMAVKAGDWMMKHKTAANAVTAVPLAGAATLTWDGTTKAANKVGKSVDPDAYKYQDSKNKQIQQ